MTKPNFRQITGPLGRDREKFPDWRKQMKAGPLARTRRRKAQAASF